MKKNNTLLTYYAGNDKPYVLSLLHLVIFKIFDITWNVYI